MDNFLVCAIYYDNFDEVRNYAITLDNQISDSRIILSICINKDTQKESPKLKHEVLKNVIIVLNNPENNLGYLNGLFYAYESVKEQYRVNHWVVFSNTDIEINDQLFFNKLSKAKFDESVYCIAPSVIVKGTKIYENPQYMSRYTLNSLNRRIFIFSNNLLASVYMELANIKRKFKKTNKQRSSFVYSAHGCFFILSINFLESINRNYFSLMYSEEAFIAEEVRMLGKKVWYESSLEVIHNESQITGKIKRDLKSKYIAESLKKIKEHYFIKEVN